MREIAYAVNSQSTLNQGHLVLDLIEAIKEGYTYHLSPIPEGYLVPKWRSLTRESSDLELFTFLLKEELFYQQKKTGKTPHIDSLLLKQVHISSHQIATAFKLLAPTQKLFCQGKQLILDLFGKTEFYYSAIPLKTGQLEIQGRLRWRETDIALSECEAVGPGKPHHWFIKGLALKLIQTSVSWKQLQELKQGPLLLEGGAKQTFLDNLDLEEPDSPRLVMKEGTYLEAMQSAAPQPILKLKDRWGACADLWMDYGQDHLIAFHDGRSVIKDDKGAVLYKRQLDVEANWEKDLLETDFIKKNSGVLSLLLLS